MGILETSSAPPTPIGNPLLRPLDDKLGPMQISVEPVIGSPREARPLPDEFSRGHHNRLSKMMGFQNTSEYSEYLRSTLFKDGREAKNLPLAKLLAFACGMPWSEYQARHTFLQLLSCCANEKSYTTSGEFVNGVVRIGGFIAPRNQTHFCMACVEQDRSKYGYSYWHRSHQMPGQFWCSVHQEEILHVAPKTIEYAHDAEGLANRALVAKRDVSGIDRDHPRIQSFYRISEHLLGLDVLSRRGAMLNALQARASYLGITTSKRSVKPRGTLALSDLALKELPVPFLKDLFPKIESKSPERVFYPIDQALMGGESSKPGVAVALASAVMFDDPETAIAAICARSVAVLERPKRLKRNEPLAYVVKKCDGSMDRIATELGMPVQQANTMIQRDRRAILRSASNTAEGEALRDFYRGLSLTETSAKHAVSRSYLEFLLRLEIRHRDGIGLRADSIAAGKTGRSDVKGADHARTCESKTDIAQN